MKMVTGVMNVRDNRTRTRWGRKASDPRIGCPKHVAWVRTLPDDQTLGLIGTCRSRSPTSRGIVTCSVDSSFVLSGYSRHGEIQGTGQEACKTVETIDKVSTTRFGVGSADCCLQRAAVGQDAGARCCVSDSALPAEASYMPVQVSIVLVCITEGPCCNANRMR